MLPVYSILFALWRFNSLKTLHVLRGEALRTDGVPILVNYIWMATCLPLSVAVGHVLLAGLLSAIIVTASHQSEHMFDEVPHDFVEGQVGI